jgi:microcystin-dependent protein
MEGTIGEIRMFAGNFAPRTWAFCQNQTLAIAQNTALFSILGTTYGGNGQTTFALPDFRGRVAVGTGTGPGLPNMQLGQLGGSTSVTLTVNNLPAHTHTITGTINDTANNDNSGLGADPTGRRLGAAGNLFTSGTGDQVNMAPSVFNLTASVTGGSQPVSIMPPYLGMNYIICLFGIFPSRD